MIPKLPSRFIASFLAICLATECGATVGPRTPATLSFSNSHASLTLSSQALEEPLLGFTHSRLVTLRVVAAAIAWVALAIGMSQQSVVAQSNVPQISKPSSHQIMLTKKSKGK